MSDPPSKSERFEIVETLGEDGPMVVARAYDHHLQRSVVLKRMNPLGGGDAAMERRILREARALAQIRHPNVLALLEVSTDELGTYFALQDAAGPSLADLVQWRRISLEKALDVGVRVADALAAVHAAGLVHRNVRAEQVLLDPEGGVLLGGFGDAHATGDHGHSVTIGQTRLLADFDEAAAPEVYAPECAHRQDADTRSDLYALGILVLEGATRSRVGRDAVPEALAASARALPEALHRLLRSLLAEDPADRPASAADARAALEALRATATAPAPAAPAAAEGEPAAPAPGLDLPAPVARARGSRRGALLTLAAAVGLGAVGLWRPWADGPPSGGAGARGATRLDEPNGMVPGYARSHALVIGIDDYPDGAWPELRFARSDAQAFAQYLVEEESFAEDDVVVLLDEEATSRNILSVLRDRFSDPARVGPNDRLICYFAGHGQQQAALGYGRDAKVGYLVPHDGTAEFASFLPHDSLVQALSLNPAKHVLMILDCCYSGWAALRARPGQAQFEALTTERCVQILTAGRPGEPVADGLASIPSGHSPFTHFLLEGLRGAKASDGRSYVTASELGIFVQREVTEATSGRQLPAWSNLEGVGDFVFHPPR